MADKYTVERYTEKLLRGQILKRHKIDMMILQQYSRIDENRRRSSQTRVVFVQRTRTTGRGRRKRRKRNTMEKLKHVAMRTRGMESMSVNDAFDGGQLGERSTLNLPQARELPGPRNPQGEFI